MKIDKNMVGENVARHHLPGLEFYRGNCRRGRTKCCGSLRQRRQFFAVYAIFILFTVHHYFDTSIQMLIKSFVNHYFSLSFLRKKTTEEIRRHVSGLNPK
jgi:hypothetical protein